MDKARIRDLEEQCATAEDEIYTLIQDRMKLQAQCAAMREALEAVPEMCIAAGDVRVYLYRGLYEPADKAQAEYRVMLDKWAAALAPDAGRDLWKRLRKAEAERVEAYVPKSFCRDQCAHWKPELEGCGEWKKNHCEVRFFHDYLRDHNHIREAE